MDKYDVAISYESYCFNELTARDYAQVLRLRPVIDDAYSHTVRQVVNTDQIRFI